MYKEIEIKTVEGEAQLTPFKATGTTAYRFKQLTKKDLRTDFKVVMVSFS